MTFKELLVFASGGFQAMPWETPGVLYTTLKLFDVKMYTLVRHESYKDKCHHKNLSFYI